MHAAGLRPFLAQFFVERDADSRFELCEFASDHAIGVKIDLAPILAFEKSKAFGPVDSQDFSFGRAFVRRQTRSQSRNAVVELAFGTFESVIDGKGHIALTPVQTTRRRIDDDVLPVGQ